MLHEKKINVTKYDCEDDRDSCNNSNGNADAVAVAVASENKQLARSKFIALLTAKTATSSDTTTAAAAAAATSAKNAINRYMSYCQINAAASSHAAISAATTTASAAADKATTMAATPIALIKRAAALKKCTATSGALAITSDICATNMRATTSTSATAIKSARTPITRGVAVHNCARQRRCEQQQHQQQNAVGSACLGGCCCCFCSCARLSTQALQTTHSGGKNRHSIGIQQQQQQQTDAKIIAPATTTTTTAKLKSTATCVAHCWHRLLQRIVSQTATTTTTTTTAAAAAAAATAAAIASNDNACRSMSPTDDSASLLLSPSTNSKCERNTPVKQHVTPAAAKSKFHTITTTFELKTAASMPAALLYCVLSTLCGRLLRKHSWQQLLTLLLLLQLLSCKHNALALGVETQTLPVQMSANSANSTANSNSNSNNTSSIVQGLALALGISSSSTTITTTTMAANHTAITTKTTTTTASTLMTTVRQQQQLPANTLTRQQQHLLQLQQARLAANGTSVPSQQLNSGILRLINRDAVLERYNGDAVSAAALQHTAGSSNTHGCRSCVRREKAKHDSLESIKLHILMRLHLTQLPNITAPVVVPDSILKTFYRAYNASVDKRWLAANNQQQKLARASAHNPRQQQQQQQQQRPTAAHKTTHAAEIVANFNNAHALHDFSDAKRVAAASMLDVDAAEMLSDDPQSYQQQDAEPALESAGFYKVDTVEDDNVEDDDDDDDDNNNGDEEDDYDDIANSFYSHVNSVYVFPTFPRLRHNRKSEVLNFKLELNHATIVRTIVHLYIRGREWMREHEPVLLEQRRHHIAFGIHRAVRRTNSLDFTHTVKLTEVRHKIPAGMGHWVQIEVKQLAAHWTENRNAMLTLVLKCQEPWMRLLIVTGGDTAQHKALSAHIEVLTKNQRRRKRSTSLDCQESDHEVRCCRYPLKVNFTNFGWHFVVAPTSFDAYFCNGECKVGYLEHYPHTHIASLTTSATPCCSPTKMSALSLLYFDNDQNLVLSTIPNMSVEKCSCS